MDTLPIKSGGRGRGRGKIRIQPKLNEDLEETSAVQGICPSPIVAPIHQQFAHQNEEVMETPPRGRGRGRGRRVVHSECGKESTRPQDVGSGEIADILKKLSTASQDKQSTSLSVATTPTPGGSLSATPVLSSSPASSVYENRSRVYGPVPGTPFPFPDDEDWNYTRPSKHLRDLGTSPVKILQLHPQLSKGYLFVRFLDPVSEKRSVHMRKEMANLFTSRFGLDQEIHGDALTVGETVAITVTHFLSDEYIYYRRLRIEKIRKMEEGHYTVAGLDIDALTHWESNRCYRLTQPITTFPRRSCLVRIVNWNKLYLQSLEPFRSLVDDDEEELECLVESATNTVFTNLIGEKLLLSQIQVHPRNENVLEAVVDLKENHRLEPLFTEAMCDYFRPKILRRGETWEGFITEVRTLGSVGICYTNSLYEKIHTTLNDGELREMANTVTEDDRRKLWGKIMGYESRVVIALDPDMDKVVRVKVKGFHKDQEWIIGILMESGLEKTLYPYNLICDISGHPRIPPIFDLVPAQGQGFKLYASPDHFLCPTPELRAEILEEGRKGVMVRVVREKNHGIPNDLPKVEVFPLTPPDVDLITNEYAIIQIQPFNLKWQKKLPGSR